MADVLLVGHYTDQRRHVVMLKQVDGDGLPIWVGESEGTGIAVLLAGVETPGPFSIVLVGRLLSAAGGHVSGVRISRLFDQTYAEILLCDHHGRVTERRGGRCDPHGHTIFVAADVLELGAEYDITLPEPTAASRISQAVLQTWYRTPRLLPERAGQGDDGQWAGASRQSDSADPANDSALRPARNSGVGRG